MAFWDSLISAGSSLLGGIFQGNKSEENAKIAAAERQQDRALQKEFAQSGIQWKTADAKKAGISPYYALGAPTASYSPVSIGDGPSSGIGMGLSAAGQDLGRAAQAAMSSKDRDDVARKSADLALENSSLQNELLKTQIARMRGQIGPAMPSTTDKALIDGQPATQLVTPDGAAVSPDKISQQADTAPATKRIRVGGVKLYTNPFFSDAEDIETRYGDIAQEVAGVMNAAGDVYHTARPYLRRYWNRAKRASRRFNRYGDRVISDYYTTHDVY